jgi:predicted membrane protein
VEISLAIGELVVIVPREATLEIDARAGIGEVVVFDRRASGLGADLEYRSEDGRERVLTLDLDVAIGKVEVRR